MSDLNGPVKVALTTAQKVMTSVITFLVMSTLIFAGNEIRLMREAHTIADKALVKAALNEAELQKRQSFMDSSSQIHKDLVRTQGIMICEIQVLKGEECDVLSRLHIDD